MAMTEAAKKLQREYKRKWSREHPEKQKEYNERYWEKKVAEMKAKTENCG